MTYNDFGVTVQVILLANDEIWQSLVLPFYVNTQDRE